MEEELEVGTSFSETGGGDEQSSPSIYDLLYGAYERYYPTGISYEEFWLYDADLANCRWNGYKQSIEAKDWEMWQQGIYVMRAVHLSKNNPYPKYPLSHGNENTDGTKAHYELNQARMIAFANAFNENFREEDE